MDKGELIRRFAVSQEDRVLLARVLDKMLESERKNIPANTHFLNDREQAMSEAMLRAVGYPRCFFAGGYDAAERRVLVFLPDYLKPEDIEPVSYLRAEFPQEGKLTHRDLLGALMGTGIKREMVGDIIVCRDMCDIIVLPEIAAYLLQNLDGAGRTKLNLFEIGKSELCTPSEEYKEIKDTVASLRLDSIVSSGFSIARGKAADLIRSGKVSVNHFACEKPDREIALHDVISARGLGRLIIEEIGGTTKKGRTIITIKRLL